MICNDICEQSVPQWPLYLYNDENNAHIGLPLPVDSVQYSDEVIVFEAGHVNPQNIWLQLLLDILSDTNINSNNISFVYRIFTPFLFHWLIP